MSAKKRDSRTLGERAADRMKAAMSTWIALFGMLFFILGWIVGTHLGLPLDNPQLTILNLILSSLAGLQCFVLLIAAKRGEAIMDKIIRRIATETNEIDRRQIRLDHKLDAILFLLGDKHAPQAKQEDWE